MVWAEYRCIDQLNGVENQEIDSRKYTQLILDKDAQEIQFVTGLPHLVKCAKGSFM